MTAKPEPNCTCRYVLRTPDHPPGVIRNERCQIHGDGVLLEGLTEPKPQAVVTTLTEFALDMHEDCCGCVRKEATHAARFVVWLAKCEAQTRREVLEQAAQRVDDFYFTYFSESPGQKVIDRVKEAIRSLISPTPVEPEVSVASVFGGAADRQDDEFAASEPSPAPSKAEELLPLGHEFEAGPVPSWGIGCLICKQTESAHRGKRGVE